MPAFRKKPVVIEANQWFKNGDHPDDYVDLKTALKDETYSAEYQRQHDWEGQVVRRFRRPPVPGNHQCEHCGETMHVHGWIDTLEGGHIVCPGDWVITGVQGERYPCKPDVFKATYEQVNG